MLLPVPGTGIRKEEIQKSAALGTPHSSGRRQTGWAWGHMPLIPALEVPGYTERPYLKQKQTRSRTIDEETEADCYSGDRCH